MPSEPTQPSEPTHEAYSVRDRVAVGTAGVVYRAVQVATRRDVTFKVLSRKSTNPLEPERVLAQRWRWEALKHPVIAELLDMYQDPDGFVIVSSWMAGGMGGNDFPIKKRTLTPAEGRHVAREICRALLVGEEQRFPHGDIKPSNIILAERGPNGMEVQIQDWGLSACRESQPTETLQFMAPERHYGHPASSQGDLFSTGATLWNLLVGECPAYGHTSEEILQDWGAFDVHSLAQRRPDLDEPFRHWIASLLRWQPGERVRNVAQALETLDPGAIVPAPTPASPVTAPPKAEPPPAATAAPTPTEEGSKSAPAPASPPAAAATPPGATPAKPAAPTTAPVRKLVPARAATATPRPSGPSLKLPVASAAPPTATATSARTKSQPLAKTAHDSAAKPKASAGQRAMVAVMVLCVLAGLGVGFVAWARDRYGHDWQERLPEHWRSTFAAMTAKDREPSPGPAAPGAGKQAKAATAAGKAAAKTAAPVKSGNPKAVTATAKPAVPKSAPPALKVIAADKFDGTGDLQGRTAGSGWKGPWEAKLVTLDKIRILIGKGDGSSASRALGPASELPEDYLTLGALVAHPGKDAGPLKFELLSPDGVTMVAPVCVAFEDGKLLLYVDGAKEKLEVPAGKAFKLVVRWNWKLKKPDGGRDLSIAASVYPPPLNAKAGDKSPASVRSIGAVSFPSELRLVLHSDGGAKAAAVADLKLTR